MLNDVCCSDPQVNSETKPKRDRVTVADVMAACEQIAPTDSAEAWDRIGLQLGDPERDVTNVLLALDVLRVLSRRLYALVPS